MPDQIDPATMVQRGHVGQRHQLAILRLDGKSLEAEQIVALVIRQHDAHFQLVFVEIEYLRATAAVRRV